MISYIDTAFRILHGLLTPVIACIAVYIAYQQYKTNRDKLRLDLYNKRYEVFYSLMKLLAHILQTAKVEHEQVNEFSREAKEAVFLFDKDISTYLDMVKKKSRDLWAVNEELKDMPRGKERSEKAREVTNLLHWLTNQFDIATKKFSKYLKFEQRLKGKTINLKRGLKRLTLAFSIIVGPLVFYSICIYTGDWPWSEFHYQILLSFELTGFISVWIIYFVTRWIIKGFCVNKTKDAKDNK